MVWTIALVVFVAQLLCCIYVDGKIKKYLPALAVAAVISVTVLAGEFGVLDALLLVAETKVMMMALLAIVIYHIVLFTKKK